MSSHTGEARTAFCLRLPEELHVRLKALAALRGVSTNELACRGLHLWAIVIENEECSPPAKSARHLVTDADEPAQSDITLPPENDITSAQKAVSGLSAQDG